MTGADITERMRVLLDTALAEKEGRITPQQYAGIVGCCIDLPQAMVRQSPQQISS